MKKIKVILFLVAASMFVACNDATDIRQPSELLPENTYQTVNDMQLGLNGVYGGIPGESQIYFTSLFTDEVKLGRSNGGQGTDGDLGFVLNNNSDHASSIWVENYYAINLANRLIKGAENVVPADEEETANYNDILAQAHFIRAFCHFQLMSYFSTDLTNDSALGVILVDYVPTTDMKKPRNTNGECFALINSDLDFADANLGTVSYYSNKGGVSKKAILAFRARMAAYRGQYAEANAFVDQLGNTNLATQAQYRNMFRQNTDYTEIIWKLERTVTGATGNFSQYWSSVNSTITGSPFFEVGTSLYNKLVSGDVRREVVIDPTAATVSYAVRPIGKYSESESQLLLGDIMVFRNSEMKFIKAEYYASISDYTNVAAQINLVRRARFNDQNHNIAVPTTDQEAWAAVLNERRLELAFEGHRYIDLKRLGQKANLTVDRETSDFLWNSAFTLPITDYRWTMPIPRSEQAANPTIQQNDGYGTGA